MKAKRQIVDESDNIIGYKFGVDVDPITEIYRVSALWLTNTQGQVLIAQRKWDKRNDPGKWGPAVAGTVEEGETYEENIYKETEEEIGLKGIQLKAGPKQRVRGDTNFFCQWYTATVDVPIQDFVIQEDEVEALEWMKLSNLQDALKSTPTKYLTGMQDIVDIFIGGKV